MVYRQAARAPMQSTPRCVRDTAERQLVILRVLPRGRAYDR